jgi:hypothetical protein
MIATRFELQLDDPARAWLAAQTPGSSWVIAYDVHRCCGGGKICSVSVRKPSASDRLDEYKATTLLDGTTFLIDPRAATRLPRRFGLTVRGFGRFKHLDLELDGDEWGELLYS